MVQYIKTMRTASDEEIYVTETLTVPCTVTDMKTIILV